jgi:cyclomaltodextrinase
VFNHAGRDFPPVAEALVNGPGSAGEAWVAKLYDNDGMITADYFEGHDTLVTLNHHSTEVQDHVRDVMLHWLRRGIDGWRLDAAYAVPPEFWAAVLHELEWTLGRHAGFVEHFTPLIFLSNHDVTRVASQIDDERHLPHAVALLGFLPGVPSVYYGDEFGLEAVKEDREGGDDAVRPELPGDRGQYRGPHPEVEAVYRRVIGLRRRHPWLVDAAITTEQVDAAHLVVRSRARHSDDALALALNLTDAPFALPSGAEVLEAEPASTDGAVAPHGWVVFTS